MNQRYIFKTDKNRESFQRWTDHRVEQFTVVISVVFVISSAALGYALALISDDKTPIEKIATWPFVLLVLAFLTSFISGILVVINRFESFRQTCEIIKVRDKADDPNLLAERRQQNGDTDSRTWCFFTVQYVSFLLGSFLFLAYAISSNWEKVKSIFAHLL